MTSDFPRGKPLDTCPHALCGRGNGTCQKLAIGDTCLKTHFATPKDWVDAMFSSLQGLERIFSELENPSETEKEAIDIMYCAFMERLEGRRADVKSAKQKYVH